MKKMAALALAMIMGLSVSGCGAKEVKPVPETTSGGEAATAADQKTEEGTITAVSYTHLTLPTKLEV